MSTIKIAGFELGSMSDGPALRNVVFFQGCPHHCPGCHNPGTHDPTGGFKMSIKEVVNQLDDPYCDITISGGEPFAQYKELLVLLKILYKKNKKVWVYTGYTVEQLVMMGYKEALRYIDTLVDGPYIEAQKDTTSEYRGSKNQRIIKNPINHILQG